MLHAVTLQLVAYVPYGQSSYVAVVQLLLGVRLPPGVIASSACALLHTRHSVPIVKSFFIQDLLVFICFANEKTAEKIRRLEA